jgi:diguanylate cyclase (GGDEF)-like protein/PAS domain S-box-containing protein
MAGLAGVYCLVPGLRAAAWVLIGLAAVLAVTTGVLANRPARVAPWLLLAAAILTMAVGQWPLANTQSGQGNHTLPSPVVYVCLAGYLLGTVGLLIFIHCRVTRRDLQRSLRDALTLTVGLFLLGWAFLIFPYLDDTGISWELKAFAISLAVGDLLVLTATVWLLARSGWRARPVQLLALGTLALLASDVLVSLQYLHGSHIAPAAELGWVVCYVAWGAVALNPAMTELTRPVPRRQIMISPVRTALFTLAALIISGVLLIVAGAEGPPDVGVIAAGAAVLYLAAAWRLWAMASSLRHAQVTMRTLRQAGVSILAASTMEEAAREVRATAAWLTGPQRHHPAVLAVRQDGVLHALGAAPGEPPVQVDLPDKLAEDWLSLLTGSESGLRPILVSGQHPAGNPAADDSAMLCPLALPDRPSGDPLIGLLAVFGGETQLAALSETIEILAQWMALVIERVLLNREVVQRKSEAYFRTLVHDSSDVILIVDDDDRIRYATPSARAIFGDVAVEGSLLPDLLQPEEWDDIASVLARMRDGAGQDAEKDWRVTCRDDAYMETQVRGSDLRNDPTVGGLVLTLRDVTAQRELEHELKYQVFHDPLTGLPNRYLFRERAEQAVAQARARGTIVAVLFIDMDDFRIVNETLGYDAGDELLVAAASRLCSVTGGAGTTARLGSDEFALVLEDLTDGAAADTMAAALVRAFTEPFIITAGSVTTAITVGVATTEDDASLFEVVSRAKLVLSGAKAAGKRQWSRYKPVRGAVDGGKRRDLRAALDDAVARSAFTLAYQPIVALSSGEVVGFEALLRWPHPEWGVIYPDQFLALAEETGQIVRLGSWALERAAADTARWQREMPRQPPLYVSVNISARQFRDPGFVSCVRRVLASTGLPPSSLHLEFMESLLLYRDEQVRGNLDELKGIGVQLVMNGFRTGHLSLNYLRELPMDVLKIEKSFVDGIAVSTQRLDLAEVIIRIAKSLRMSIIAAGIESEAQRDLLVSMGCPFGQGYLMSRPLGPDAAEALLRVGRRLAPELEAGVR